MWKFLVIILLGGTHIWVSMAEFIAWVKKRGIRDRAGVGLHH